MKTCYPGLHELGYPDHMGYKVLVDRSVMTLLAAGVRNVLPHDKDDTEGSTVMLY